MSDKGKMKVINRISNFGYITACLILFAIAVAIIVMSVWSIFADMQGPGFTVYKLLDEVSLIIFSIAVFDVAKYLMQEEVLRQGKERRPAEARRALTKFAVIIATALSLEGLVLTIEVAKTDVTQIIHPVYVLITGTLFIVGIGVYQRLNAGAEKLDS